MNLIKKLFFVIVFLLIYCTASAQIEVAHLTSKNFSATGFGSFLNVSIPFDDANAGIIEGGVYVFSNGGYHEAVAPVLLGFRHLLSDTDYGFYVEPVAGYTFGGTDLQETDANGNAINEPDGTEINRKVAGFDTGLGFGYLFEQSGPIRFNISLRYEHSFVKNDPALNIIAIRISHSFSF